MVIARRSPPIASAAHGWLMDNADRAALARLGDQLAIYRGFARPGNSQRRVLLAAAVLG
jgi:hypothetical protein